jgi:hypothetical protein
MWYLRSLLSSGYRGSFQGVKLPDGENGHSSPYCYIVCVTINGVLDWWMDWLSTYTHDSELQAITTPPSASTIHKLPPHLLSFFQTCYVFTSRSLATASNSGDSSVSSAQFFSSQPPIQNWTDYYKSSLHRLPYRTELTTPSLLLTDSHTELNWPLQVFTSQTPLQCIPPNPTRICLTSILILSSKRTWNCILPSGFSNKNLNHFNNTI